MSRYQILFPFYRDLNKFNNLNPQKEHTRGKKATGYDDDSELYKVLLEIYFYEYRALSDDKKRKLG